MYLEKEWNENSVGHPEWWKREEWCRKMDLKETYDIRFGWTNPMSHSFI